VREREPGHDLGFAKTLATWIEGPPRGKRPVAFDQSDMDGVDLITVFAQLFVCSLHIRDRARTEFDCLRAVRKCARNLA